MPFTPPSFSLSAFNCPHCEAFSRMYWRQLYYSAPGAGWSQVPLYRANCTHCDEDTFWLEQSKPENTDDVDGQMIWPNETSAPMPHPDMPEQVKADFDEARNILRYSPRGAAALLRLSIQKLCVSLGEKGNNINDDIGSLVAKGLPIEIQQALDIVRVIGNNAVHPGELSEEDVGTVAVTLFELVNQIVEDRLSRPKRLNSLFDKLPKGAREAIEKRDKKL